MEKFSIDSESDVEVIDNSIVESDSFSSKIRTPYKTAFIAESENSEDSTAESGDDDPGTKGDSRNISESGDAASDVDDDPRTKGHSRYISESDDDDVSPEMLPRRPPPPRKSNQSSDSPLVRKIRKRMIFQDSDLDDSITKENNQHRKITCLKDTPLKIDKTNSKISDKTEGYYSDVGSVNDGDDEPAESSDDDDGGEDQMVMSRATRMSIMGVIPKENESDESDFIQSDESKSLGSNPDLVASVENFSQPQVICDQSHATLQKNDNSDDDSRISCSPFSSPLNDVTNSKNGEINFSSTKIMTDVREVICDKENFDDSSCHLVIKDSPKVTTKDSSLRSKVLSKLIADDARKRPGDDDDEVTFVDKTPLIITLSSDDDEAKEETSPKPKRSPKVKSELPKSSSSNKLDINPSIKQYLLPASYPNQVTYVTKQVRDRELAKLNALREDVENVRKLIERTNLDTFPDNGKKLKERLEHIEQEFRRQGDKVGNLVVEPDVVTPDVAAKDGFGKQVQRQLPSWDDLQKASNAVQPKWFGKQGMATHAAERNEILERLRDLHESMKSRPAESVEAAAPRAMTSTMMQHQLHALAWLRWRETQRPQGGILADDMGLGKTITMISLVASDKEKIDQDDDDDMDPTNNRMTRGGTLVVCPASLIQQWGAEVKKHCAPHALSVCLHHGAARAQQPHRLAGTDLVVTTYNILQRDKERKGVLMRIVWRRIILDEAHIVRNHKSLTSAAVSALAGRRRWCLTGTPVQNKDLDLFALLKFLRCTPFDDLTMWKKWIDNKSHGGEERLSTIMRCILLRRTKVQLQQQGQLTCLPERTAHEIKVTLPKDEMNVYQKVLVFSKTLFAQYLHQRAQKQAGIDTFQPPGKDTAYYKMHKKMIALQGAKPVKSHEILVLLLRLRQVCCHCGLIAAMLDAEDAPEVREDPASKDLLDELHKLTLEDEDGKRKSGVKDEEEENDPEESTTVTEAIRSVLSPNNPVFNLKRPSSKINAVMECLKKNVFVKKGDKAVVVSQWTSVLRLVEAELNEMRVRSITLSGQVPVSARQTLINTINDPQSDVKVMLLSLCAGGVGLNLCGANHLLLLDPHWNPQLEEQAQDRIYRVGQSKHVHIYRFVCVDTVEQSIRALQLAKLEVADNVLTGAKNTNASKLTIEELKVLFNMGQRPVD